GDLPDSERGPLLDTLRLRGVPLRRGPDGIPWAIVGEGHGGAFTPDHFLGDLNAGLSPTVQYGLPKEGQGAFILDPPGGQDLLPVPPRCFGCHVLQAYCYAFVSDDEELLRQLLSGVLYWLCEGVRPGVQNHARISRKVAVEFRVRDVQVKSAAVDAPVH